MTIKAVSELTGLHWETVREIDKRYIKANMKEIEGRKDYIRIRINSIFLNLEFLNFLRFIIFQTLDCLSCNIAFKCA